MWLRDRDRYQRFRLLIVALALVSTSIPLFAQDAMRDTSTALVKDLVESEKVKALKGQTIVIAEFANINVRGDAVPKILQEKLTTAFIKSGHFEVVERAQLEKALKELKIDMTGLIDPDTQKRIGKMLGASLIVLGSISEANSKISIDARIVSIESGKAVGAADAVVGGDVSTGSANAGSGGAEAKPATTGDEKPTASLLGEGTYLGRRENAGALGGSTFKAVWRERISGGRVASFSAGNLKGDGVSLLAVAASLPDSSSHSVAVFRWQDGRFRRTWQGQNSAYPGASSRLRVIPSSALAAYVIWRTWRGDVFAYRWDGTQYSKCEGVPVACDCTLVDGLVVCIAEYNIYGKLRVFPQDCTTPLEIEPTECSRHGDTAADLDGDGKVEIVKLCWEPCGGPLEVFTKDWTRKAITENSYGDRATAWQTVRKSRPYIAVCKNDSTKDINDKEKPSGGYFYLLQWDGDMYSEIWKSPKLDDKVVDLQVCDPKNEGKLGLVVLSEDSKGSVLTKFVAE